MLDKEMSFAEFLRENLLNLPEPILLVGNKLPDGDSLGSALAILDFLRFHSKEAYVHCVLAPAPNISWMLSDEDSCDEVLDEYASLVVVDDQVDSQRLGIDIKDVPILCIDHHHGNFPEHLQKEISLRTIHDPPYIHREGNRTYCWKYAPATACLLIDADIFHPNLFVSLYQDTVGFTVNCVDGFSYASTLLNSCELSNDDVEEIIRKLNPVGSFQALESYFDATITMIRGIHNDESLQILVVSASPPDHFAYLQLLDISRNFSNVTCFVNRITGKTSIRSDRYSFDVQKIAQVFGGNGHIRASGFSLNNKDLINETDRLIRILTDKVSNPRIKVIM